MAGSMPDERWTWDPRLHTRVKRLFNQSGSNLDWSDQLEAAPANVIVGKVLCVCAAAAIAREALGVRGGNDAEALGLLDRWIDDPTDDRFERLRALVFGEDGDALESTTWWALRTAMSTVGYYEAGWALEATCQEAEVAGIGLDRLREVAASGVLSRRHPQ